METEKKWTERGHRRHNPWRWAGWILLSIVGFAVFLVLAGFVIMWLWNWIMPSLFNLSVISFWQAVGIAVLARLVLGNTHRGWHHWRRKRWGYSHGHSCECSCHCDGQSNRHSTGHPHEHSHNHSYDNCDCKSPKWQYYDKYWEEEGEKAFQDYVERKSKEEGTTTV